jgi:hypothetical protein
MLTDQQLDEIIMSKGMKPYNPNSTSNTGGSGLRGKALLDSLRQKSTAPDTEDPMVTTDKKPDGFFSSVGKSIAKPFAELGTSVYNVGASANKLLGGDVEGASQELGKSRDLPWLGETKTAFTGQESIGDAAKKIGGYGAEVASTVAPIGKIGTGAKALAKGAGRMALQAGVGTAGRELEETGTINPGEIAKSAALGAAIPVGLRGASGIVKGIGEAAAAGVGKSTGAGVDAIKEAFKNPNVMKFARQAGKDGGAVSLQREALENAHEGLNKIVEKRGAKYRADLERVTKESPIVRNAIGEHPMEKVINDARGKARKLMDEYGLNVVVDDVGKPIDLGFDQSTITQNKEIVKKALKDVLSWEDNSPAGLDTLKKRLSQFKNDIPPSETGGAKNFIQQLHDSVRAGLNDQVPGYKEMTKSYAEASDLIDEIKSTLSLKDTAREETAIKKLMSSMRDNNELRKDFVDLLTKESGQDIMGKVAGSQLSQLMPKGIAGATTGLALGHFVPASIPLAMTYLAASSPRLVGEFTNILGQVTPQMVKANKFSEPVRNKLVTLLTRSVSESD